MSSSSTPRAASTLWRQFYVFLLAVDLVILFVYLLIVPENVWENMDKRLRAIGSLVAGVLTYLGLDLLLRRRLANSSALFDTWSFRGLLWFLTVILWGAVLPVWSHWLVFSPPQRTPPAIIVGEKSRYVVDTEIKTKDGESLYQLEGLLLRDYEVRVVGVREPVYLSAISILKGTFLRRPIRVQLPCALVLPIVRGALVKYRRFAWEEEEEYGPLPDDGKVFLMPGHYDYVKLETREEEGSNALDMECPQTELQITLERSVQSP